MEETFAFRGYEMPVRLCLLTGGGPETFETISDSHMTNVNAACGLRPDLRVLEIGCGIGRDAIPLTGVLGPEGRYVGVDVIADSIAWCAENISRRHPNFAFVHQDIADELHNPRGTLELLNARLPVPDRSADLVLLWSVFTHMLREGVAHYLREIARVLAPQGLVYATVFLVDERILASARATNLTPWDLRFEHAAGEGVYVNDREHPTGAVAYREDVLRSLVGAAGLEFVGPIRLGAWSGAHALPFDGQDVLVLHRAASNERDRQVAEPRRLGAIRAEHEVAVTGLRSQIDERDSQIDQMLVLLRTLLDMEGPLGRADRRRVVEPTERQSRGTMGGATGYEAWRKQNEEGFRRRDEHLGQLVGNRSEPLISVVVPVYQPGAAVLRLCVESVRSQLYRNWELCLCDDASEDTQLTKYLQWLADEDERIKITSNRVNQGIAGATNAALALATGTFVAFLDQDDALHAAALAEIMVALLSDSEIDVLYTDEDKIDEAGRHFDPFFKPAWSPELLESCAYMCHLLVVRRDLLDTVGSLRSAYNGSQDYDLMLRATERARKVAHVPRVLYHWRAIEGSAAADTNANPWARQAAVKALTSAVSRRDTKASVEETSIPSVFRVRRELPTAPIVSVIVPFRDQAALLERCVRAIHTRAGYERYEVLLVDNESWEPETEALLARLAGDEVRVLRYPGRFNYSAVNNWAVRRARGDVLLFLNNDVEAVSDGFMHAMLEYALRADIGPVGARLVFDNGEIQHAGVVLGMGGLAGHVFSGLSGDEQGYFSMDRCTRNYLAVTAACLMLRRSIFEDAGGFDEGLRIDFNDVDLCLRLHERGLRCVYTPYAELLHHESVTRGIPTNADEVEVMGRRWRDRIEEGDPYFNPNLTIRRTDCSFATTEEMASWLSRFPCLRVMSSTGSNAMPATSLTIRS